MTAHDLNFQRAAWLVGRLVQGVNPSNLDLSDVSEPWDGAIRAYLDGGKDALDAWSNETDGGADLLQTAFSFAADAPDPATVDVRTKTAWTMAELLAAEFPEPTWAIPGVLPVGLSTLAGRPKVGKSWLALQFAQAVGTGGIALCKRVEKGRVLYLGLEDSPRRLQDRAKKQLCPATENIDLRTTWQTFGQGGLTDLVDAIDKHGYTLVIIDTLSRILGRADQMDLAQMTTILGELQRTAHLHECAILTIDHQRKNGGFDADVVDDVLGSSGKTAVCDAILGLYKERGKQGAVLKVTGRDVQETELALEWDAVTCTWQSLGDAATARQAAIEQDTLAAIKELSVLGELPTGTNIARHIGQKQPNVASALADLLNRGLVTQLDKVGVQQPYGLVKDNPL